MFPWVLSQYQAGQLDLGDPTAFRDLSKPVGALDSKRLERLRQRYADMRGDPEVCMCEGSLASVRALPPSLKTTGLSLSLLLWLEAGLNSIGA